MASSLQVTVAHAVAYLIRPLVKIYSASTILTLQSELELNLCAQFSSTWSPMEPLRGSGRRCLTLSPTSLAPRPIHAACQAAGVDWSQWIALLCGVEFDFFVDPGCVSLRFASANPGKPGKFFTVWSDESVSDVKTVAKPAALDLTSKTLAQQLLEEDNQDENELFAMISQEIRDPTWVTPIRTQFPSIPEPFGSPIEDSPISRSSSRASSSSGLSFSSSESLDSSSSQDNKMSRRERARSAKVYVDTTKKEVTNYDGGKTTVLTGGVMLGGGAPSKPKSSRPGHSHSSSSSSLNWRSPRA